MRDDLHNRLVDLADVSLDSARLAEAAMRRGRRWRSARTVAVASGLVGAFIVGAAVLGPSGGLGASPATSRPRFPYVVPGDRVAVAGRVVLAQGQPARLCLGSPPDPPSWLEDLARERYSVCLTVTGLDPQRLVHPVTVGTTATGFATFTGVWTPGHLTVGTQNAHFTQPQPAQGLLRPPCAAPAGGWPRGQAHADLNTSHINAWKAAHPGVIISNSQVRVSLTQAVWVVATSTPAVVERALKPSYGKSLCVVTSRWTEHQFKAATQAVVNAFEINGSPAGAAVLGAGDGLGPDGQPVVSMNVLVHDRRVDQLLQSQPPGLLKASAWIHPIAP